MTAEPDLLPLLGSVADWLRRFGAANGPIQSEVIEGWFRHYARANVAHATAFKDAEIEALRAKTAMTMGVGTGDGKLFVHGDYESIKAAQEIVLERDALRAEVDEWRRVAAAQAELHFEAEERAERLAQAARGWMEQALNMWGGTVTCKKCLSRQKAQEGEQ